MAKHPLEPIKANAHKLGTLNKLKLAKKSHCKQKKSLLFVPERQRRERTLAKRRNPEKINWSLRKNLIGGEWITKGIRWWGCRERKSEEREKKEIVAHASTTFCFISPLIMSCLERKVVVVVVMGQREEGRERERERGWLNKWRGTSACVCFG